MTVLLDAALAYAAAPPEGLGWPVFPCDPRQDPPGAAVRKSKAPLLRGADLDAEGQRIPKTGGLWRASAETSAVRQWWMRWSDALIGLPTGSRSGVFVIDLDPRGEAVEAVEARLVEAVGPLPHGPRAMTQSGGLHLYYRLPADEEIPRNSAKRLKGVDWRGEGGYVILPPSVMADGKAYSWVVRPSEAAFPEAPPALLDLVFQRGPFARAQLAERDGDPDRRPAATLPSTASEDPGEKAVRRYALAALDRARSDVAATGPGTRGHTLNAVAFGIAPFVGLGVLSEREVIAALRDGADACGLTATDGAIERDAKIERGLAAAIANTQALSARLAEIRAEAVDRAARYGPRPALRPVPPREGQGADSREESPGDEPGEPGGDAGPPDGDQPDGEGEVDPRDLEFCVFEPQNDVGNGARLRRYFGRDVLGVAEIGPHIWTGSHWERRGSREILRRLAHQVGKRIKLEALAMKPMPDEGPVDFARRTDSRRRFATSSGNVTRINGMISEALAYITVSPEELDAEALAINVKNGTLRLAKKAYREPDPDSPDDTPGAAIRSIEGVRWKVRLDAHRREDRLAKIMPVAYDATAACPKWQEFMERFQPKEPIRRFLQAFHGYALTGLMGEQSFVYNYGLGANGKSTFMEAIARLMGGYAQLLPAEALTGDMQRRGDQATPEYARLPGARLVRCAELPRGQGFRESTLKMLTGGEPFLVRHLHQGFFEMRPSFKAIGSGNDRPTIGGVDEGIWRRIKLVPWEVTIPPKERRPMERVLRDFQAEGPGILNWLLEGLVDYLENGLVVPAEIQAATESYRSDMDPVGEFTSACVAEAPGQHVTARDLYNAYVDWCHANSVKNFAEKTFAGIMVQKGFRKESGRIKRYLDVALTDVPPNPDRASGGQL